MKKIILIALLVICSLSGFAQATHTFEIKDGSFVYDGKPIFIHSGEMHFARVPQQYWRHRLKMIKAMGLNTVATYVFWNYQEVAPGVWDFKTGNRNIREFIKTAQEEGLMVILRPGPYACAEWEFGGYPWWLQKNKDLVIRGNNKAFLDSCRVYINQLAVQVKDLQVTRGGPVIMVQAENEFGSYVNQRKDIPLAEHKAYSAAIKKQLLDAGFDVPLYTSDGDRLFEGGTIEGALPTANGEDNPDNLKKLVNQYHAGAGPYMVAEFYPGWLDHWGEPFVKVAADASVKQMEKFLKADVSFNLYMVHGGTNFGFTSGANYDKKHDIQPDITSYDYDAPINESGWVTSKYTAMRNLMKQYVDYPVPEPPAAIPVIAIPSIKLSKATGLFDLVKTIKPVVSDAPLTFEDLNQGSGYVLYRRHFERAISGKLDLSSLRDYALVYINGKRVAEPNRNTKIYTCAVDIPAGARLDILVENMGRINYGVEIVHNLKGIISAVKIDDNTITGNWQQYQLPMDKTPDITVLTNANTPSLPTIYHGTFNLTQTGDTFLNMAAWGKGIVFVNGHNLGRYWKVGPQQTLYLPGCWLKKGKNIITVFEQQNDVKQTQITSVKTPVLDKLTINTTEK